MGLNDEDDLQVTMYQRSRILPDLVPPVQAWVENEELQRSTDNSPGENRRLLSLNVVKLNHLQTGLSLGLKYIKQTNCTQISKKVKPKVKSKFQIRTENIIKLLKPPYFITCMIIFMAIIYLCSPDTLEKQLEWSPKICWREPWRLVTYGFLHGDASHLIINALTILVIGWYLEREQGWARVVVLWAVALAAGALGAGVLQPRETVVGASAVGYALLTAHLPNVFLRFDHIPLWWFRPLSVFIIVASEGFWALSHASEDGGGYKHVAWSSHALGAATGITVGFLVFTGEYISKTLIKVCRAVSALLIAGGIVQAFIYYYETLNFKGLKFKGVINEQHNITMNWSK